MSKTREIQQLKIEIKRDLKSDFLPPSKLAALCSQLLEKNNKHLLDKYFSRIIIQSSILNNKTFIYKLLETNLSCEQFTELFAALGERTPHNLSSSNAQHMPDYLKIALATRRYSATMVAAFLDYYKDYQEYHYLARIIIDIDSLQHLREFTTYGPLLLDIKSRIKLYQIANPPFTEIGSETKQADRQAYLLMQTPECKQYLKNKNIAFVNLTDANPKTMHNLVSNFIEYHQRTLKSPGHTDLIL